MLGANLGEHREDRLHRFLEHLALGFHVAAERRELRDRGALAHAEFAAAPAEQIEHRDALGDARRVVGGELKDAMAEPDLFRPLTSCREKRFWRRRVGIFFQEMVLHDPRVVVAEPVGGLELRQCILLKPELVAFLPWTWQLQLIKDAEFHDALLPPRPCFLEVYSGGARSPTAINSMGGRAACATRMNC